MKVDLILQPWAEQHHRWPQKGRRILAQWDDESIVVYQAYRPSIASHAVHTQTLGGPDFSFSRMSWIKPNFLWMMHRSSWASAPGQERVLALRVRRTAFDAWLAAGVPSSPDPTSSEPREAWQAALARSNVVFQWDPDHDPSGKPTERRAIQIGLRNEALRQLAGPALVHVDDITDFVVAQRGNRSDPQALLTPVEAEYPLVP